MWNSTPPTPTSNPAQPIRALLPGILRRAEQQQQTLRTIQRGWGRLVGKRLAAHARPVSLQRGRLIVAVDRPGDGFLLSYQRAQALERLQAETGGAIHDIVIRPSDPSTRTTPPWRGGLARDSAPRAKRTGPPRPGGVGLHGVPR